MSFTFSNLVEALQDHKEMGEFARSKVKTGRDCLPLVQFIMEKENKKTLSSEEFTSIRFFFITCQQLKSLTDTQNADVIMNETLMKLASDIEKSDVLELKFRFLREGDIHMRLLHAIEEYRWRKELVSTFTPIVKGSNDPIEWYKKNNYKLTFSLPENKLLNKLTEILKTCNYNFE